MLGNQQYLAGERYNKNMKGLFLEGNKRRIPWQQAKHVNPLFSNLL